MTSEQFWQEFLQKTGRSPDTKYYECFHFTSDERLANELLQLVLMKLVGGHFKTPDRAITEAYSALSLHKVCYDWWQTMKLSDIRHRLRHQLLHNVQRKSYNFVLMQFICLSCFCFIGFEHL